MRLEHRSRGIAIVSRHYKEKSSEDCRGIDIVRRHYKEKSSEDTAEEYPLLEETSENIASCKRLSVCSSDL
jgi:hypothetical protein